MCGMSVKSTIADSIGAEQLKLIDTPIALMRGILGSLSFLNLAGRIQPNQRESHAGAY